MTIATTLRHKSSPDSEDMIFSFLTNHPQGVLTTLSKDGTLQSSAITVFDLDNYHLAFMTKKETRKYKNLLHNQTVSFLTFDTFGHTEVAIEGIAQLVTDEAEKKEILKDIKGEEKIDRRHVSPFVKDTDKPEVFVIYPRAIHMTVYWVQDTGTSVFKEAVEFDLVETN